VDARRFARGGERAPPGSIENPCAKGAFVFFLIVFFFFLAF
jgi:hypothetical protein